MTDMTPEEINRRISTWAGLDSHVCDEWSFHCDDCERGSIQTPDYYGSNAAMDLLGVLVERGYTYKMLGAPGTHYMEIGDSTGYCPMAATKCQKTPSAAIYTAILKLIEREKSHVEM